MCKVSRRDRMPVLTQFDKGTHRSRPLFGVTMERKQLWIWLLADNVDQLGSKIDWKDYNGEALDRNWEVLPLASIQFHRKPMEINGRTEWISLAWQADSSDYTPSPTVWVPPPPPPRPQPPFSPLSRGATLPIKRIFLAGPAASSNFPPPPPLGGPPPPPQRAQSPCSSMYLEVHVLMKVISSMDKRAVFIVRTARAVGSGCSAWRVVFQTEVYHPCSTGSLLLPDHGLLQSRNDRCIKFFDLRLWR